MGRAMASSPDDGATRLKKRGEYCADDLVSWMFNT